MMPAAILIWTRLFIIGWVTMIVAPYEGAFEAIDSELVRRGIDPDQIA